MGLFHGDIEPRNTLFWPTAATGNDLDLGEPPTNRAQRGVFASSENRPKGLHLRQNVYCTNPKSHGTNLRLKNATILAPICLYWVSIFSRYNIGAAPFRAERVAMFIRYKYKHGVYEDGEVRDRLGDYVGHKYGDAVRVCLSFDPRYKYGAVSEADIREEEWRAHLNKIHTQSFNLIL